MHSRSLTHALCRPVTFLKAQVPRVYFSCSASSILVAGQLADVEASHVTSSFSVLVRCWTRASNLVCGAGKPSRQPAKREQAAPCTATWRAEPRCHPFHSARTGPPPSRARASPQRRTTTGSARGKTRTRGAGYSRAPRGKSKRWGAALRLSLQIALKENPGLVCTAYPRPRYIPYRSIHPFGPFYSYMLLGST